MVLCTPFILGLLTAITLCSAAPVVDTRTLPGTLVNIRIEGATKTIYEGVILTKGHNVTTASGGTHRCDGTNLNANPTPGPTCTSALDDTADLAHFTWDGAYSTSYDDYFITRIGESTQTSSQFWGILRNWQFTPVGGCQQQVIKNDQVLWAYDAFSKVYFLKLEGPKTAKAQVPFQVTVSDGSTGALVSGATIAGLPGTLIPTTSGLQVSGPTDSSGHTTVTFTKPGIKILKGDRSDSLRSNALAILVTP